MTGVYELRDRAICRDCGHKGFHRCEVADRREALEQIRRNMKRLVELSEKLKGILGELEAYTLPE